MQNKYNEKYTIWISIASSTKSLGALLATDFGSTRFIPCGATFLSTRATIHKQFIILFIGKTY